MVDKSTMRACKYLKPALFSEFFIVDFYVNEALKYIFLKGHFAEILKLTLQGEL